MDQHPVVFTGQCAEAFYQGKVLTEDLTIKAGGGFPTTTKLACLILSGEEAPLQGQVHDWPHEFRGGYLGKHQGCTAGGGELCCLAGSGRNTRGVVWNEDVSVNA